ncbi:MAG: flagellar protein FliS [bacterium]
MESLVECSKPEIIILKLYDLGIAACHAGDKEKVRKVLHELTAALNFDYYEIAKSFYDLYEFSLRVLEEDRFCEVLDILIGLRSTWEKILPAPEGTSQPTQH